MAKQVNQHQQNKMEQALEQIAEQVPLSEFKFVDYADIASLTNAVQNEETHDVTHLMFWNGFDDHNIGVALDLVARHFPALTHLEINSTTVRQIPPEIGGLKCLKNLYGLWFVNMSELTAVADELSELVGLTSIGFYDCPLLNQDFRINQIILEEDEQRHDGPTDPIDRINQIHNWMTRLIATDVIVIAAAA
jgi:hypothetical protein